MLPRQDSPSHPAPMPRDMYGARSHREHPTMQRPPLRPTRPVDSANAYSYYPMDPRNTSPMSAANTATRSAHPPASYLHAPMNITSMPSPGHPCAATSSSGQINRPGPSAPQYSAQGSHQASHPPHLNNSPVSGPTPTVYLATYSSVPVYEITVRGIALMRRRSDGYLNATQILKIAGIEKARRTRILEREILTGEHDKVQGGYGTFQGTWIPLQRAQELAINYSVYHLIRPLLDFDPSATRATAAPSLGKKKQTTPASSDNPPLSAPTPQHARPASQQPRFLTLRPPPNTSAPLLAGGLVHPPNTPPARQDPLEIPAGAYQYEARSWNSNTDAGNPPTPKHPTSDLNSTHDEPVDRHRSQSTPGANPERSPKRTRFDSSPIRDLNVLSNTPHRAAVHPGLDASVSPSISLHEPRFADKAHPPNLADDRERRTREVLTGLFVEDTHPSTSDGRAELEALLQQLGVAVPADVSSKGSISNNGASSPLDLVIDDHGHTALHWASALCRLPLVKILTALPRPYGANLFLGNYAGETALHRSVLVTNAYEQSQFAELLDWLHDSLHTRDLRKRTILHHIALVAGLKGRAAPAKYYLSCVLAKLQSDASDLLDAQDDEGETALSIAARLGNTPMIKMLLDAGARKDLPNYLGITPMDWGITGLPDSPNAKPVAEELSSFRPADAVKSLTRPPAGPVQKSDDVRHKLTATLSELQLVFERETQGKQQAIYTTQKHLQQATRELATRRKLVASAQQAAAHREEAKQKLANLKHALESLSHDTNQALPTSSVLDSFIASAENVLDSSHASDDCTLSSEQRKQYVVNIVQLRWAAMQYHNQAKQLSATIQDTHRASESQRAKYLDIVAMCAHVPPNKVDGMLDELVAAVESIGSETDLAAVSGFLQKVGKAQDSDPIQSQPAPQPDLLKSAPTPMPLSNEANLHSKSNVDMDVEPIP
ncbi:transcriptional regulator swi6 [Malassezia psittaci]|uniref:Transcriptional regulator swi6 n=1 Tax=Malassezia psittaci TaxID=1821823 RepID=A0AAF0JCM3_9BASI|nr:transcriptional regulator swi6 [Malassezia psittaci]